MQPDFVGGADALHNSRERLTYAPYRFFHLG